MDTTHETRLDEALFALAATVGRGRLALRAPLAGSIARRSRAPAAATGTGSAPVSKQERTSGNGSIPAVEAVVCAAVAGYFVVGLLSVLA